jgi:transposase
VDAPFIAASWGHNVVVVEERHMMKGTSMEKVSTVGLDLAKNVFQVHGIDPRGEIVIRRQLRRGEVLKFFAKLPPCLVGMEACGTSHHWAREIGKFGHEVRLMPAAYVKAYVRRGKTDAADAAAICEAVTRPSMRFVPVKSVEQQSVLMLHRVRSMLVRQRTMMMNALRGHLAELGIAVAQGVRGLAELMAMFGTADGELPAGVRMALMPLVDGINALQPKIKALEAEILARHRADAASRRLETIPGIGFVTASALTSSVPDISLFSSGREFAAWLGLTPMTHSSGGKERIGEITRMGDGYLRTLLVVGATAVIRSARTKATPRAAWIRSLLAKKPWKVVAVAVANKMARIVWAVLTRGQDYCEKPMLAVA